MTNIKQLLKRAGYALAVLTVVAAPLIGTTQASAGQMTLRKVTLSNSLSAATNVTYTFNFTVPSATVIQSASFQFCTAASGACSTPGSFAAGSAALASQPTNLGDATGWTTSNSSNSIRILKSGNVAAPTGAQTVEFNTVTNPTLANGTFFVRISTFSDAAWTTEIDTGSVAASTAGLVTVNATVDETLTFTLAAQTVSLLPAPIGTGAASFGVSTMAASTNAASGYNITYSSPNSLQPVGGGTALTAYTNAAATPGTPGFGINIVDNVTPNVGANPSGGSGTAQGLYANVDAFTFVGSNTPTLIARSTVATNTTSYTVSYAANIDALTAPGAYTTNFTYVATPNF